MTDSVDHTGAPESLVLAHAALKRLMQLVWIKVQFPVHVEGVGEASTYVRLRNQLLESLKQSGQHDLLDRATTLFPARLAAIIDGEVKWDANTDIRLLAELEARCEEAGLDTAQEVASQDFDSLDAKLGRIEERSMGKHNFQTQFENLVSGHRGPPAPPPPNADTAWPLATDEALTSVLAPPLPVAQLLPAPESGLIPAAEKPKNRRVAIDPPYIQRVAWEMHDNPARGEKEHFPSAQDVCDHLPTLGHRPLNEKSLREQMHESGLGWPPPRPAADD